MRQAGSDRTSLTYLTVVYTRTIIEEAITEGKTRRVSIDAEERAAGGVRPFLTAHFLTPPRLTLDDAAAAARTTVSSLRGKGGGARLPVIVRDLLTLARLSAY